MFFRDIIQKYLLEKTDNGFIQFLRYCFVGGLAFLVDYGMLYVLSDLISLHYIIAASVAFIAGLVVNYFLSTRWVFSGAKLTNKRREFIVFALIGVVGLFLTDLLMYVLTDKVGFHYLISKLVTAAIVLFWNFIARKVILF